MIRKRVRLREALLPSDGRLIIASRDGLVDRSAENSDGSVSKAAAELNVTPSAVTQQIQLLEMQLGRLVLPSGVTGLCLKVLTSGPLV